MEPESSLPHSQVPVTCPCPESDQSSPFSHIPLPEHLNIILPSIAGSSNLSLSFRFPHQNPVYTFPFPHTCYVPRPFHSRFDDPNNIGRVVLSSSLCSFLHSSVVSSLIGPNILLSILFSEILSLRSSLNVSNQFSHPYKTTDKIIVL